MKGKESDQLTYFDNQPLRRLREVEGNGVFPKGHVV